MATRTRYIFRWGSNTFIGRQAINRLKHVYQDYIGPFPIKAAKENALSYFLRAAEQLHSHNSRSIGNTFYFGAFREPKHLRPCLSRYHAKLEEFGFVRKRKTKKPAPRAARPAGREPLFTTAQMEALRATSQRAQQAVRAASGRLRNG